MQQEVSPHTYSEVCRKVLRNACTSKVSPNTQHQMCFRMLCSTCATTATTSKTHGWGDEGSGRRQKKGLPPPNILKQFVGADLIISLMLKGVNSH